MSFKVTHDLHRRQFGRNVRVGLLLVGFIILVLGLTVNKVTRGGFAIPSIEVGE